MAAALLMVWLASIATLRRDLGRAKAKPEFRDLLSKSRAINVLSAARMFLFGARDVWFVVALPVFLTQTLGWDFWQVGGFMAAWIIGYGIVQSVAPYITGRGRGPVPKPSQAWKWAASLSTVPLAMAWLLASGADPTLVLIVGLAIFGLLFAINSSLHSYLIVACAERDGVSLDVGFYYMANAIGRLMGTVLSGWVFQQWGLTACLVISAVFVAAASLVSLGLPSPRAE